MTSTYEDRIQGTATSVAIKAPVRVATTGNITLSGLQTIDGVAVVAGDRVGVIAQTNAVNNGIYVAAAIAWVRAIDMDGTRDVVSGTIFYATAGSTQGGFRFWLTTASPVIGTTALAWSGANVDLTTKVLYVDSIAEMTAIAKASLADGQQTSVAGYTANTHRGGGIFVWRDASTVTADGGTCFAANEGGTGRWRRLFDGVARPNMFGAVSGSSSDQVAPLTLLYDAINSDTAIRGVDMTGIWRTTALPTITRSDFRYFASGYCLIEKMGNGNVARFTGDRVKVRHIEVDGGGFDNPAMICAGHYHLWFDCEGYNTTGHGISITNGVTNCLMIGCSGHDTDGGGIGPGKTEDSMYALNRVWNTGAEGMPLDEGLRIILLGNMGFDCGGAGAFATDKAMDCAWVANLGHSSSNGLTFVENRLRGSENCAVVGNVFPDNTKVGVKLQNKYRHCFITGISRANPCVITLASISITGVTLTNPCRVTAVGHGKTTGDKVVINTVVGTTELNTNRYKVKVISADIVDLYSENGSDSIDATGFTAYVSGGNLNHPYDVDDRPWPRSVGGMTQINGLELRVTSVTNTTITVRDANTDVPLDSSGFSAYTTGGYVESGGIARNVSIVANVTRINGEDQIRIEDQLPLTTDGNHIVVANQAIADQESYGFGLGSTVINRAVGFEAVLTTAKNNKTGNGAAYTLDADQVWDTAGAYNPVTGIFTAPSSRLYSLSASGGLSGMGGATSGTVEIICYLQFGGTVKRTLRSLMIATGSAAASSVWRGDVSGLVYMEQGETAKVVLTGGGLGADTADLVADGTTYFSAYAIS